MTVRKAAAMLIAAMVASAAVTSAQDCSPVTEIQKTQKMTEHTTH